MPELSVHVVSGLVDKGCHFGGAQQELKPGMDEKRSWRKVQEIGHRGSGGTEPGRQDGKGHRGPETNSMSGTKAK